MSVRVEATGGVNPGGDDTSRVTVSVDRDGVEALATIFDAAESSGGLAEAEADLAARVATEIRALGLDDASATEQRQ